MLTQQAIPSLLQDVKPILTHLKESDPSEEVGTAAKEAVDRYMNTLDVSVVLPFLSVGQRARNDELLAQGLEPTPEAAFACPYA